MNHWWYLKAAVVIVLVALMYGLFFWQALGIQIDRTELDNLIVFYNDYDEDGIPTRNWFVILLPLWRNLKQFTRKNH